MEIFLGTAQRRTGTGIKVAKETKEVVANMTTFLKASKKVEKAMENTTEEKEKVATLVVKVALMLVKDAMMVKATSVALMAKEKVVSMDAKVVMEKVACSKEVLLACLLVTLWARPMAKVCLLVP